MSSARWLRTAAALGALIATALPAEAAETLYSGGDILTMAGAQPTYAEALVERGGRIVYVGALAGALKAAGTGARRVDDNPAAQTLT